MKNIYFLLILLTLQTILYSQKWDTIFGNAGTSESFQDVIECYDKGYLISGSYENPQANWLIKTDINRNVLWDKFITWDNVIVGKSYVRQNLNGEIIAASGIYSEATGYWPMITKLDSCGEIVWCRVFPNYIYDMGWYNDILVLENNDILALVQFVSTENDDWLYLDYIDSDGNLKWRELFASQENHPHIRSCGGDEIGKFGDNYIIHGECYYPYPSDTTHFYLRPLYIMLDSLFNEQWVIPFGVSDSIIGEAYHTISLNDSIFMGVGPRRINGAQNSLLMFFDKNGEELGYNQIPNEAIGPDIADNFIYDIERINDTIFLASSNFGTETMANPYGEFIIDTAGTLYNFQSRPNTHGTSRLIKTFDNKYVIGVGYYDGKTDWDIYLYKINENLEQDTVYSGNYTYDSLCPYQIQSGEIDISDCLIVTDVGEVPSPGEYYAGLKTIPIKAYPNPVNGGEITFEFGNTGYLATSPPSVPPNGIRVNLS